MERDGSVGPDNRRVLRIKRKVRLCVYCLCRVGLLPWPCRQRARVGRWSYDDLMSWLFS